MVSAIPISAFRNCSTIMGISNEQYSEIMRDYERTQRYNRDLDLANRDEVYSAIPELSKIDNTI